jgi:polyisoprenoid-binding protein YceI
MKRLALALAFGAALTPGANALEYTALRPEASAITFAYQQMGVGLEGRFTRFDGELSFDPARPEAARARIEVELASIDTGSPEGNDEVAGKAWFDTPSFPRARFVSQGVKALGDATYEVSGTLSIKGREQAIVVPATVTTQGDSAVLEGRFTIRRGDFAIGEGEWAAFDIVANEVQVTFRFTAASGNNPQQGE